MRRAFSCLSVAKARASPAWRTICSSTRRHPCYLAMPGSHSWISACMSKRRSSNFLEAAIEMQLILSIMRGHTVFNSEGILIMTDRQIKIPGPDHPISIDANPSRIVVTVGGKVIADSRDALTLREASYPAVQYIPRRDVDMAALTRSEHTTYCPYKGDASYYSIPAGGDRSVNAVWTYESPFEAMTQIKEYVAFYPDRVDEISVT